MKNSKKIIFVVKNLNIGGVQKALINFVNTLVDEYDITILSLEGPGLFERDLSQKVIVKYPEKCISKYIYIMSMHKSNVDTISNLLVKSIIRFIQIIGFGEIINFMLMKKIPLMKDFDVAISYTGYPGIWDEIVSRRIISNKKMVWIHNNPYHLRLDKINTYKYYSRFDTIINVSEDCKNKFNQISPRLSHKNHLIYNVIDSKELIEKSLINSNQVFSIEKFNIVTVARIQNSSKRVDRIIETCKLLIKNNYKNFEWFIVGDGPDSEWLEKQIVDYRLEEYITKVGFMSNPYPYISSADLFVLTSDYEGLPVTLVEAKTLGIPILVTDLDCAKEIINDGFDGMIVSKSSESVYEGIKSILDEPMKYIKLKENSKKYQNTNMDSIKKFIHLLSEV